MPLMQEHDREVSPGREFEFEQKRGDILVAKAVREHGPHLRRFEVESRRLRSRPPLGAYDLRRRYSGPSTILRDRKDRPNEPR